MNIGISRPTGGNTVPEVLQAAQKYGFTGLQWKTNQYGSFIENPGSFKETFGDLADMTRGGLIFYPDGNALDTWTGTVTPVIRFAAAVGADHLCLCAGISREYSYQQLADMLNGLGTVGKENGVMLSLHNHAGSLFETAEDFDALVPLLEPDKCGITLDTGHTAKAGIEDASSLVEKWKSALVNVHLKDMDTDGNFCLLGTGTVTLKPVVDAMLEVGYDRWLIIDEETKDADLDTAFSTAQNFLQKNGISS